MRQEHDAIGSLELPEEVLYDIETARSLKNFALGPERVNTQLIQAILLVKKAAILTQSRLKLIDPIKADAILQACDQALSGEADDAFVTHPLQGGAGTSTHMNVNEVLANLALKNLGETPGRYDIIHPLDDINRGQSTNDVYPTALRIAAIRLVRDLSEEASRLQESLQKKELEFSAVSKLGRTEMMDAVPITLGQEFGAYAQAIARDRWRIYKVEERLRQVNLGGTAVGTGSTANRKYALKVIETLRQLTGLGLSHAEYPMDLTQNQDVFVEVSGLLKTLAVSLMKIAGDLRLMNSGPHGGFGEIHLEARQAGSTLMPGKVNPVMPEMITQVAVAVMANDYAITICAASGNLELNAFLPLIADRLLNSLNLLIRGISLLRVHCIDTLTANPARCLEHLQSSTVPVTMLAPYIGYEKAAELSAACKDHPEQLYQKVLDMHLMEEDELRHIFHSHSYQSSSSKSMEI